MQKISPCLWFDDQAEEAVKFYTSLFKNSKTGKTLRYDEASAEVTGRPEGSALMVDFELNGYKMVALNGGPLFNFTPAISFFIRCNTAAEVDRLWEKLSEGGQTLMPLDKYPFSDRYGWVEDKYGVSWQIIFTDLPEKIAPCLLFVGDQFGKAEEAVKFYKSVFQNSSIAKLERYAEGEGDKAGAVKYAAYTLDGDEFVAMESSHPAHQFTFTEAISLMVNCKTQEEVDCFWETLTQGGEESHCGWLKDKFGVSWQIVPEVLLKLHADPDKEKAGRVMKAMLTMDKLDIAALEKAAAGRSVGSMP